MKKVTTVFVVIFIVFNLIVSTLNLNTVVAANSGLTTEGGYKEWDNTGNTKATINGTEKTVKATGTENSTGATGGIIADVLMLLPWIASNVMTDVVKPKYINDTENITDEDLKNFKSVIETAPKDISKDWVENIYKKFSILNLVLGYYDFFDIYFFDDVNEAYVGKDTFNTLLKRNISVLYVDMRNIALVISAISLIYIGIRMAIATVSTDKARYKKLLKSWFVGFILLFLFQYIAIFIMELSKLFQQIIAKLAQDLDIKTDFEYNIINRISTNYTNTKGFSKFTSVIIYWFMIYYQCKFFIMYLFRQLEIAILIIISPLITFTYSIDKSADGRSQVFNSWWKELTSEILLQNLHCIAYLVFVISAGNIALKSPILAIIFFGALTRVEKIVRNVFKIKGKSLKEIKLPFLNK